MSTQKHAKAVGLEQALCSLGEVCISSLAVFDNNLYLQF